MASDVGIWYPTPMRIYLIFSLIALARGAAGSPAYFGIRVVDADTGRGIPLVELETVNHIGHVTDSDGRIAFEEPGLMGQRVFFKMHAHGYEVPKDGFGAVGKVLDVVASGSAEVRLRRANIAERLYRITGQGIYRDTILLGGKPPLKEPALNGQVMGQDSVQAAVYRGKIHWFWGDTQRPSHTLGHFQTSGAVSELPGSGGLDPASGIDLRYYVDDKGFSARMAPFPEKGLIWIDGVLSVKDAGGRERLVTHYSRMKDLGMRLEHGLAVFDDDTERFVRLSALDASEWRHPSGHPVRVKDGGREWLYFADPCATVRAPATFEGVTNAAAYEALARDEKGGRAWRADGKDLGADGERELIKEGDMAGEDAWFQPKDAASGKTIRLHRGSVNWNAFRKKWVMIACEQGGTSLLGEIWYAEADAPEGPWRNAVKIVTHDKYSFYNPAHHPFFDQDGGRLIYFEGTYTQSFSGNPTATPRYDYNQIMYRLDLADPRLSPAR